MKKKPSEAENLNREIEGRWRAHQNESWEKAPKRGASGSITRNKQDKTKKQIDKIQRGNEFTKENLAETSQGKLLL